jgi:glycosyltransferase involved in cell wall biosynthesis
MFALKRILEEKGHSVIVFSMNHPLNYDSENSRYFVSYINYEEEVKDVRISSGIHVLKRTVYSREAKNKIERLIENEKPDIAHVQNIHHHITPSIFYVLKRHKIPMVWTLHDYTVMCPNTSFLSHGKICEKCKTRKYYWPALTRCKKNSLSASTMAALETIFHRLMGVNKQIDMFIAPSEFLKNKLIEYGFDGDKIVCLRNFNNIGPCEKEGDASDYYLYIGRLAAEKGVKTLIDAAARVNKGKLRIVGDGPLKEEMVAYARSRDTNGRIEFLGHKTHEEVITLLKRCQFVVIPSEWYENFPFAILETFACGKPVIGSNTGGIPELIKDTERGLIFKTGDADDLVATIRYLLNNPDLAQEMGDNAKAFMERELNGERHYEELLRIYKKLL